MPEKKRYWALDAGAVAAAAETSAENGLSSEEAQRRLRKFGANELPKKRANAFELFLRQFTGPLVLILLAASVVSAFLGELTDAVIIIAIVAFSGIIGFVNEFRSEKTIEQLEKRISHKALVLRDGEKKEIDARHLVPGDVVFVAIGDIVPADLRIISCNDFSLNEAAVTGESAAVEKVCSADRKAKTLLEARNCAPTGSVVAGGHASAIVVATGGETEFGKIAGTISEQRPETDFAKGVRGFGYMLIKVVLGLTAFIFVANSLLGRGVLESLLFALAIAVGVTPELLPTIVAIGLATGARQMAKKHVVVKRLASIEDFGDMDVLCTDKTGTLTEGSIELEGHYDVNGRDDDLLLEYSLLCNSAAVGKKLAGNSIDVALWKHALKRFDSKRLAKYDKLEEIEFDYERRRMSVIAAKGGRRIMITKGAVESVLEACTTFDDDGVARPISLKSRQIRKKFLDLATQGYRVIAVASKQVQAKKDYSVADEADLTFLGYVVFSDPLKNGARDALVRLAQTQVELKILTGDNEYVTQKICGELGLPIKGVVLGPEISEMDAMQLAKAVEKANVFARVTPEQKLRIIHALKHNGHVVGFLGDGVNDAPALHEADVGVSVDSGVDVAKEAADIVLLRKDIHVLVDGIAEGRKVFRNTIKYILNTISANFGNMFTLAISSTFLPFIPLLPPQILLNNLLSDAPMTTVSTDRVDSEELARPKRWNTKAITRFMIYFGLLSSVFDLLTMAFLVYVMGATESVFQTGWFLESVFSEIVIVFSLRTRRPFFKSRPSVLLTVSSIAVICFVLALVYSPAGAWFGFVPPTGLMLAAITAIVIAYLALVEFFKHWFFKKHDV